MKRLLFLLFASLSPYLMNGQTASVQIIHNSDDAAAEFVDVYVNGVLALDDFEFRTATPFIDLPAGVPLNVGIAPGSSSSVDDTLFNANLTLMMDQTYVVIANGIVSGSGYDPMQPFGLNVFAPAREMGMAGSVDLLVMHGSTDAPTVDVEAGGVTLIDDLSYGEFTMDYLTLPTGDYVIDVTDETGSVVVASYSVPLSTLSLDGTALTVVASGFLDPSNNSDGPAFGLYVASAAGGDLLALPLYTPPTARLQVIHNSANAIAAEVDVYLNDVLALDNFAFRTATPFIDVPANTSIEIAVAPRKQQ